MNKYQHHILLFTLRNNLVVCRKRSITELRLANAQIDE